jgi:hypothetical protein
VRLDLKYALAYAAMSELYISFANNIPTRPAYADAKQTTLTGVQLDDRVSKAHRDLAWFRELRVWLSEKGQKAQSIADDNKTIQPGTVDSCMQLRS